jgi:hypothetical protein
VDPYLNLRVGTDPTVWRLENVDYAAVAAELSQAGPVVVDVAGPLPGRLVIAMARAGSASLFRPPVTVGTHPTDIAKPPPPLLYLPTVTGVTHTSPGYELARGTDLGALEQSITAAIRDGSLLPVEVSAGLSGGLVVLNGAALDFAMLSPASP